MFKSLVKTLGTLALSVIAVFAIVIGHVQYEVSHYVPPPIPPTVPEMMQSVVYITTEDHSCSGWIDYKTKNIITAAHCKAQNYIIQFQGDDHSYTAVEVKVGDEDAGPDIMVLKLDGMHTTRQGLPLCTKKPFYGEFVAALGAPVGDTWTSLYTRVSNPSKDFPSGKGFVGLAATTLPGESGGPIVDTEEGCVVAMADFIHIFIPGVPVGNAYAISAESVREFLK